MKTRFALAALAAACLSTFAAAQAGPGMDHPGMGPGMMGGQAMGQGMGPGMMGGHQGCGKGREMMGGHDFGHATMRGRGMMGGPGHGALEKLNLNDEQRGKVREIHRDLQRKHYALMGSARDLRWQAEDAAKSAEFDEAAARKRFDAGAAIRKQMFEARLEAHARVQEVLTKEQREQLRQGTGRERSGPFAHH